MMQKWTLKLAVALLGALLAGAPSDQAAAQETESNEASDDASTGADSSSENRRVSPSARRARLLAERQRRRLELTQNSQGDPDSTTDDQGGTGGDDDTQGADAEEDDTQGAGAQEEDGAQQEDAAAGDQNQAQDNQNNQPGAVGAGAEAATPAQTGGAGAGGAGEEEIRFEPNPEKRGKTVSIYDGEIPMRDFLRFLSDFTGITVLPDTTDRAYLDTPITIVSPIHNANEEIVKAILEANKVRLFREKLSDGTEIIKVEPMRPTGQTQKDPKEITVYRPDIDEPAVLTKDEFATMVFTLKNVPPSDAIEALRSLVGGATGTPARGGAAAARLSTSFSMVEIKNTDMLIITAKFGLLSYLKTLLELIDVPPKEPEPIFKIIQIEYADASEIQSLVSQFIESRGGSRFARRGQRQISAAARPAGQAATPTRTSSGTFDYTSTIVPDVRSNKLIVKTYYDPELPDYEQDLHIIEMLIGELDVRFDLRRVRTHIYQVRYLKAIEVAQDLQMLIAGQGGAFGGRRTARPGLTRARTTIPRVGQTRATPQQGTGAPQNVQAETLIVPHEPTNSLLIQAETEEYAEILNILSKIDTKRRQVFLEAALVQVTAQSSLAFAIDLIAGNPDDRATRALFASNFTGLTGIDENFNRTLPFPVEPGMIPDGGFFSIMRRGDLPLIVTALKNNQDSEILATPFILADDNEENRIDILETRFVPNTITGGNQVTTSSQQGEPAGITLAITPTISGSEKAVFLTMDMTVSEFDEASSGISPNQLPPKKENTMTSSVTIPDGQVFVVGGLTRESKSKVAAKVPILGDIPIIGKLFRKESSVHSRNNLYVFLQAHILTDEEFDDGVDLTNQAQDQMGEFSEDVAPVRFHKPEVESSSTSGIDPDEERFFHINDTPDEAYDPFSEGTLQRVTEENTRSVNETNPPTPYNNNRSGSAPSSGDRSLPENTGGWISTPSGGRVSSREMESRPGWLERRATE